MRVLAEAIVDPLPLGAPGFLVTVTGRRADRSIEQRRQYRITEPTEDAAAWRGIALFEQEIGRDIPCLVLPPKPSA